MEVGEVTRERFGVTDSRTGARPARLGRGWWMERERDMSTSVSVSVSTLALRPRGDETEGAAVVVMVMVLVRLCGNCLVQRASSEWAWPGAAARMAVPNLDRVGGWKGSIIKEYSWNGMRYEGGGRGGPVCGAAKDDRGLTLLSVGGVSGRFGWTSR
jgi:hypothetical protein